MRIAYFDCFSGISGNSLLGALVDAGLPLPALAAEIAKLPMCSHQVLSSKVEARGVVPTFLSVVEKGASRNGHANGHNVVSGQNGENATQITNDRYYSPEMADIIVKSTLSAAVKDLSLAACNKIIEAESRLYGPHGPQAREAYGPDAIVAIVGVAFGLSLLDIGRVECSPVNTGSGFLKRDGDLCPVLAPLTAEILRGASIPIYGSPIAQELVTPVGAAIIAAISAAYGPAPLMRISRIGYGVGGEIESENPVLVRLMIGEAVTPPSQQEQAQGPTEARAPQNGTLAPTEESPVATATPPTYDLSGHQQSGRQRAVRRD